MLDRGDVSHMKVSDKCLLMLHTANPASLRLISYSKPLTQHYASMKGPVAGVPLNTRQYLDSFLSVFAR